MNPERIRPTQCFRLRSGEIVRIRTVQRDRVCGDLYVEPAGRWRPLPTPLPFWALYAVCRDPSRTDELLPSEPRWWQRLRRAS